MPTTTPQDLLDGHQASARRLRCDVLDARSSAVRETIPCSIISCAYLWERVLDAQGVDAAP